MKVFKFGGASVKDADAVRNVVSIINNFSERKQVMVVVSAMGKTTNKLEDILSSFLKDEDFVSLIEDLKAFHFDIITKLFQEDPKNDIFKQVDNLFFLLEKKLEKSDDVSENELYDQIICFGELISTHIIAAYLNHANIPTQWIDARHYILASEDWKEGIINWDWTEQTIRTELPNMLENQVLVTQGFIGGSMSSNKTVTLGREGSDFSAAIFGACLDADHVTIWKDVPGILNADPRRIRNTILFNELSYKYAAELTYYGASVIHPKTIRPLAIKNIPLLVKSFIKPEQQGTRIGNFPTEEDVTSIIFKSKQSLITFEEKDFLNVNRANIAIIFKELARYHIEVNLTKNSAHKLTICTNTNKSKFRKLVQLFDKHFHIESIDNLELVTIKNPFHDVLTAYDINLDKGVLLEQKTDTTYQLVRRV
ncbi:aspartate kinase [Sediminitomix flava]|uniref:Aspartokinase n=1 Tax=Sediminitomix flava TaxID=379075 RepID=A0A315Z9Z4_SEDFL|nr:aspartate kinase [Sediminitomix flava]PWJ41999.1 aspartate kinase [Sediminitomix flava]